MEKLYLFRDNLERFKDIKQMGIFDFVKNLFGSGSKYNEQHVEYLFQWYRYYGWIIESLQYFIYIFGVIFIIYII